MLSLIASLSTPFSAVFPHYTPHYPEAMISGEIGVNVSR
jgi:hypothetical protein